MHDVKELHIFGISLEALPPSFAMRPAHNGQLYDLLCELAADFDTFEVAIMQNDQRLELYFVADSHVAAVTEIIFERLISQIEVVPDELRYHFQGAEAMRHLCNLAAGNYHRGDPVAARTALEESYATAAQAGSCRHLLAHAFHAALNTADRTIELCESFVGEASTALLIADLVRERFDHKSQVRRPRFVILGADQAAKAIAVDLVACDAGELSIIDTDYRRASALAHLCQAMALPISALSMELLLADCVIDTRAQDLSLVYGPRLQQVMPLRLQDRLLLVTSAHVQPTMDSRYIEAFTVDQLQRTRDGAMALRRGTACIVEQIIDDEVNTWQHGETPRLERERFEQLRNMASIRPDDEPSLAAESILSPVRTNAVALLSARRMLHDCATWLSQDSMNNISHDDAGFCN